MSKRPKVSVSIYDTVTNKIRCGYGVKKAYNLSQQLEGFTITTMTSTLQ